jgi:hypothetical protein
VTTTVAASQPTTVNEILHIGSARQLCLRSTVAARARVDVDALLVIGDGLGLVPRNRTILDGEEPTRGVVRITARDGAVVSVAGTGRPAPVSIGPCGTAPTDRFVVDGRSSRVVWIDSTTGVCATLERSASVSVTLVATLADDGAALRLIRRTVVVDTAFGIGGWKGTPAVNQRLRFQLDPGLLLHVSTGDGHVALRRCGADESTRPLVIAHTAPVLCARAVERNRVVMSASAVLDTLSR